HSRRRKAATQNAKSPRVSARAFSYLIIVSRRISVFGRPGSDLLFQALRLSIIGAGEFNGRVRDGIGYRLPASTTRSAKNGKPTSWVVMPVPDQVGDKLRRASSKHRFLGEYWIA